MLGVYPSALHIRWKLPAWAQPDVGRKVVGALAVADEPTVFWNGGNATELVEQWRERSGFVEGDQPGEYGHVSPAGNGTSGASVEASVLTPLRIAPESTWFSDCVDRFFVKAGDKQQGGVMSSTYDRFVQLVASVGHDRPRSRRLLSASLPERPTASDLVRLAVAEHRDRLRHELIESRAPLLVSLGEEARRTVQLIVDEAAGPPTTTLAADTATSSYGQPGTIVIDGRTTSWLALVHPGNRSERWVAIRTRWAEQPPM